MARKTTAKKKSAPKRKKSTAGKKKKLDAFPDRIDIRDWMYQPTLDALPDILDNRRKVPAILDQGQEGACTGFALGAAINYLLAERGVKRIVSPRMLYEMARCYDEWPGESYEGSSARGAMKGWARHGVCERRLWKDGMHGREHLNATIGKAALATPAGAYYRVDHKNIRDVHAALAEVGIVYCTIMVHEGWDDPGKVNVRLREGSRSQTIPVISRIGRASSGHAIALVGYGEQGFIVQNSWGKGWGRAGFALLPYEDFVLHATDVWVAQTGVPVSADLWERKDGSDTTSGRFRGSREIPLADIRPYIVDVGNNGELSETGRYWTSEKDLERLFTESIPNEAARRGWTKNRVMLYLHGGLNDEDAVAKRVVAFRETCLANEIYPLHLMWETGALQSIGNILEDMFTDADERASGGFFEGLRDAKDMALELTASPLGTPIWSEMKENAWRASDHRAGRGAIQLMKHYAQAALGALSERERQQWELHVVAHSAGSILFAHAVEHFCTLGVPFKTVQFYAPAVRIDEFSAHALPKIVSGECPKATIYILDKGQELDDTVGPYGRSLLWLVSNAFEGERGTPILGMAEYLDKAKRLQSLAFNEVIVSTAKGAAKPECTSRSHGGFDNDVTTMNATLTRILGKAPKAPFKERDLDY